MNLQLFFFLYNLTGRNIYFDRGVFFVVHHLDRTLIVITAITLMVVFVHDKDWKRRRWIDWVREVVVVGISVIIPWLLTVFLKIVVHAPRPFVTLTQVHPLVAETPYTSFPSGHATVFFALAMVMYLYHKRLGYFFFVCAVLIALSRVVSGVHYPIDIVVGAFIGISIAYLSTIFFSKNK